MMYKTFESFSSSFWIYEIDDGWNIVPNAKCNLPININDIAIYFNKKLFVLNFYISHPDIGTIKLIADITPVYYKDIFIAINCCCDKQQIELYCGINNDAKDAYTSTKVQFNRKYGKFFASHQGDIFLVKVNGKDIGKENADQLTVPAELISKIAEVGRFRLINDNGNVVDKGIELDIPIDRIMPIYTGI